MINTTQFLKKPFSHRFPAAVLVTVLWASGVSAPRLSLAQQRPGQESPSSAESTDAPAPNASDDANGRTGPPGRLTDQDASPPTSADDADETDATEQAESLSEIAKTIVERTNAFRERNNQASLTADDELEKTAEAFAKFMAANDKYGHRADGRTPAERAKAHGYEYCVVRENIAFRRGSSLENHRELIETFVQGWIDSDEHRANMLADYITETGVAVATTDQSTFYAVQLFGRPESLRFQIELRNETEETQELTLEQDGDTDSFELPPRVRLKVTRCLPTNFTLNGSDQSLTLQESAELVIVLNSDNEAELQRTGEASDN